ncbi:MAG TPA: hypothetical protein VGO60_05875 [Iamia sp.]|jgi:predicted metal-dependent enzyme (double-stranded beta helix superfamily)|nr:hypothetical protein [Iamia sp.]
MDELSSLEAFVEGARRRLGSADPTELDGLMQAAADRRALAWVAAAPGSETMLHRSDELTVFVLAGVPLTASPPHEHTMGAMIAVLEGAETNVFYEIVEQDADPIREVGRRTAHAGEVLTLDPTTIHSVRYPTTTPTIGLHVYLGDLIGATRRLWTNEGDTARPYDQTAYDALRTPIDPVDNP